MSGVRTGPARWGRPVATGSLVVWGVLHVVGGASLIPMGATEGLDTLGPDAATSATGGAGETVAALLHFHGLNVAAAGLAVLVLAGAWHRSRRAWQAWVGLAIALVLDVGLVVFLVGPGLLPASQGLLGPALLALAFVGYAGQTPRKPEPVSA